MNIPNIFWKYYDLFRRKKLTLKEFSNITGISTETISQYLEEIAIEKA